MAFDLGAPGGTVTVQTTAQVGRGGQTNFFGLVSGGEAASYYTDLTPQAGLLGGGPDVMHTASVVAASASTPSAKVQYYANRGMVFSGQYATLTGLFGEVMGHAAGSTPSPAIDALVGAGLPNGEYTIPARSAMGVMQNTYDPAGKVLSNDQPGKVVVDFAAQVATLNLTMNKYSGADITRNGEEAFGMLNFAMRLVADASGGHRFDNAHCASEGCEGIFEITGDSTFFEGSTGQAAGTNDGNITVFGHLNGPQAEEFAGGVRQVFTVPVGAMVTVGRITRYGRVVEQGTTHVATAPVTTSVSFDFIGRGWGVQNYARFGNLFTPNTRYYASDTSGGLLAVVNDAVTITSPNSTVTMGSPTRLETPAGAREIGAATTSVRFNLVFPGSTSTLILSDGSSSVRTVAGATAFMLIGNSSTLRLLQTAGGSARKILSTPATLDVRIGGLTVGHTFAQRAFRNDDGVIHHFLMAEYAAFGRFYEAGSPGEYAPSGGAFYGVRTPDAVVAALAARGLNATYDIPQGGAQGLLRLGGSINDYFVLYNESTGTLSADFGAGLVELNLNMDGWKSTLPQGVPASFARTQDLLKVENFQMSISGSGFSNAHCYAAGGSSGAGCGGGLDYIFGEQYDLKNSVHGGSGNEVNAAGMFAGPSAEEVVGSIEHTAPNMGMEMYFLGAGAGGRTRR